jgi:hypothetical protein
MVRSWSLILLLYFAGSLFGQEDPVLRVRKPKTNPSSLPHIGGCFTGEISFQKFCSGTISTDRGLQITSFVIRIEGDADGSGTKITGNRIPGNFCERGRLQVNTRVFITDIISMDSDGKIYPLPNMNLHIKE